MSTHFAWSRWLRLNAFAVSITALSCGPAAADGVTELQRGLAAFERGAYAEAQSLLRRVLADPAATGALHARAALYIEEIESRTMGPANSAADELGIALDAGGRISDGSGSERQSVDLRAPATSSRPATEQSALPATRSVPTRAAVEPLRITVAAQAATPISAPRTEPQPAASPLTPADTLEDRQQQLYQQLLLEPGNIDLMFDYVAISFQLRNYEAAIATLERMLIYRRDLPRIRLELGAAYYALGTYEVSRLYFQQVLDDPTVPPGMRARATEYLDQIDGRTARSTLSLVANLGITYATNARLAPLDDEVTIGGIGGFVLDEDSREEDDFGVRTLIYGTHSYDLQQPNTNAWLTDFSLFGLRYFEVEEGNTLYTRVRTGPRLALDAEQFGPKIRPYLEGQYLNADDETVYVMGGGGAEYTRALGQRWAAFADLGAGYFEFDEDRDDEDMVSTRALVGAAFFPSRDLGGRVAAFVERDFADEDFNSNIEAGLRASADWHYDSGIGWVDRRWTLSSYADARYRWYDEPDDFIDPGETREDVDLRLGVSHLFALKDGFGLQLDIEALKRDSNIQNFDLENLGVTLSAQKRL